MDFLELLSKEYCFREGGFSILALLGLPEAVLTPFLFSNTKEKEC
jgi:hypothetical protein